MYSTIYNLSTQEGSTRVLRRWYYKHTCMFFYNVHLNTFILHTFMYLNIPRYRYIYLLIFIYTGPPVLQLINLDTCVATCVCERSCIMYVKYVWYIHMYTYY
jgi:hypothetical protein